MAESKNLLNISRGEVRKQQCDHFPAIMHRVAAVNTDNFQNLVKNFRDQKQAQHVHIKLVNDMKNDWFYAFEKSATRQKTPFFGFFVSNTVAASFYYF